MAIHKLRTLIIIKINYKIKKKKKSKKNNTF